MDYVMLAVLCVLIAIGTVSVYTATVDTKLDGLHVSNLKLFGFFCIPMMIIAFMDYRYLVGKLAYAAYGIGLVLLVIVKLQGITINGAVRWLVVGDAQLQPSELMKLATILMAAHLLHRRGGEKLRLLKDVLPLCLVFLVPTYLIYDQPDLGTALVFLGIFAGMIWMGNIRAIYVFISTAALAAGVWLFFWMLQTEHALLDVLIKKHQMDRIQTFLNPTEGDWHVANAMRAIAVGGSFGDDGYYLKNGFIPYAYSDSIYVALAENFGFMGSAVMLMFFYLLVYRMILAVHESRDLAGSYLVVGIICMLVFQVFVNIGMHIGILPLTGLSLPFISYGGSSLFTNMMAVGIALSVWIHRAKR
ncbi:FtsW/RodA/SpoVE family cell cycle protein [Paenibacillus sp. 1P07SE]|uniref:FtsW/RodA/SpoVE family cell cycle protein n=1 Tax=Paenibacillus sp. 1P07SE TaxID=3132209 RepID=UPI0039A41A4A